MLGTNSLKVKSKRIIDLVSRKSALEDKGTWLKFFVDKKNLLLKSSYLWAILLFAFLARTYKIGSLGVNSQELGNIKRIFDMDSPVKWLNENASTNLYYVLQNIWGKIFGFSLLNMRLLSVLLSILGLFVFFKFTEEWFNRKLAYIATFLLSISSFHILVSRNVSHEVLYLVIVIGTLHLLTLAYRYKIWQYFLFAGALLGFGFYTSETTFVLAILLAVTGAYFYSKNKKIFTAFIKEKAIMISAAVIVSLPFFYSLSVNPSGFLSHFTYRPDVLLDNARSLAQSLVQLSPRGYMFSLGNDKVFDPFVVATFILGFVYIAAKIKRRKFYFLVVWLSALSFIIVFENVFSLGYFIYLVPVIFIMSARIQVYVLDKWFKTFPFNKFARIVMVLGVGFLFSLSLSYNFQKVFLAWDKSPERLFDYNDQLFKEKPEQVYLYKLDYPKEVMMAVVDVKNKDNIKELPDIESLEKNKSINIMTSPVESYGVKSKVEDAAFKEYKGKDIVLLMSQ